MTVPWEEIVKKCQKHDFHSRINHWRWTSEMCKNIKTVILTKEYMSIGGLHKHLGDLAVGFYLSEKGKSCVITVLGKKVVINPGEF